MLKRDDRAVRSATVDRVVALALPATSPAQVVVISGPPGSGRTSVLREAVEQLQHRAERSVVWLDCSVFAQQRSLRSLYEALASTTPRVFPAEMAHQLTERLSATPAPGPDDLGALLWSVIGTGINDLAPQVVVLDDFHLLDRASQQVASYLVRRVAQFGGVPVLLAVLRADGGLGSPTPTVDVEALTIDEVRQLTEDLIGAPVPYRVAKSVQSATGGNLLGVAEVVGRLAPGQLAGRDILPHPLPLGDSAARRLLRSDRLDAPEPLELLAALAVDPVVSLDQARRLVGSQSTLDAALANGWAEETPRGVRACVQAEALAAWTLVPGAARRRVHRVLADGLDLTCAAVHDAVLGRCSPAKAFEAATECLRLGDLGHVALTLDAADWSVPLPGLGLAEQLMADGYVASVRRIVDAPTAREAPLTGTLDGLRSQLAVLSGHVRDPLVDPPPTPPDGSDPDVWVRTVLGTVRTLIHREDLAAARQLLDSTAAGLAAAPPAARALARFVRAELGYQRREEWALTELTRAAEDWLPLQEGEDAISISIMVFYLLAVGNPALAGTILNRTEPSVEAGSLVRVAHLVGRVQHELVCGHYVAADHLIAGLDRAMPYSEGGAHATGLVINVAAARGPEPVRDRIEWRLDHPDLGGQPPHARSEVAAANGLRCLVEGSYGQALVLLDQALRSRSALFTGASAVLASLLETNRALGASAVQNRSLRANLGEWWPDRYGERFAGIDARCNALCAEDGELDAGFRAALERSSVDFPVDVARTHLAYGRCLLQADRLRAADQQLERAAAVFANEGLHGWVAHVQRLRRRGPTNAEASQAVVLTPTEREIVTLVLKRRTNADIASTLFMSKRTIELHLTRVFRKLQVSRKSELIELDTVRELLDR